MRSLPTKPVPSFFVYKEATPHATRCATGAAAVNPRSKLVGTIKLTNFWMLKVVRNL